MEITNDAHRFEVWDDRGNRLVISRYGNTLEFHTKEAQDGEVVVGQVNFPYMAGLYIPDPSDAKKLKGYLAAWLMDDA